MNIANVAESGSSLGDILLDLEDSTLSVLGALLALFRVACRWDPFA